MNKYKCHEIPQPDFDASFDDDMKVVGYMAPGGGIEEAPEDDIAYSRKNKDWVVATEGGGGGVKPYDTREEFPETGETDVLYLVTTGDDAGKTYYWDTDDYYQTASGASSKEDITGLKIADSPEFANIQITTLYGGEPAGALDDDSWTWLGATAKSVLSVLIKIIQYLYSVKDVITYSTNRTGQAFTGVVLLDRDCTQYNSYTMVGALELSVGANPVVGGFAEGIIVGNGVNTPTLNGITLWPESLAFDPTAAKQNKFIVVKYGGGVYIKWTQMN